MKKKLQPGYISMLAVIGLTSVMLLMLTATFRFSLQSQEIQKKTQVRIDYAHREQAILRAVLTEFPNRTMQSMMTTTNSSAWETKTRWRWIFEYGRDKADALTALDSAVASVLGIEGSAVSGNTGDGDQGHIITNVTPTVTQSAQHQFYINSGINSTGSLLGPGYPEALSISDPAIEMLDRDRPIVTMAKTYSNGSQYKLIRYPNVHFGYATQGQNFVAKRNWWAFSIVYGASSATQTGVQTSKKNYVLSLYEVPSQLALGSTTMTYLGLHADGSAWANSTIQGSVFATRAATEGTISLSRLGTREGATIGGSSSVGGVALDTFSGELQLREQFEADNASFYPLSSSSDSGLVAFIPINRGNDAFDDLTDTSDANSASPTGWNYYSRPAMQCAMKVRVEDVLSSTDQTPTRISFTYKVGGIDTTEYFTRGVNWPTEDSTEGATFPFHLEQTQSGRQGIAVYVGRLVDHLAAASADSLAINSSILVNSNYRDNVNISRPNIPSLTTDLSLIFRDAKDLTAFPNGFSLVTPYRMYLANDVNLVPSGVDVSGNAIHPPLSLFAPEKRFGVREQAVNIDFEGQLNYLNKDRSTSIRPLDLRSGVNDEVVSSNIAAKLYSISDPSQLPPINQMNWLVVIEEVR